VTNFGLFKGAECIQVKIFEILASQGKTLSPGQSWGIAKSDLAYGFNSIQE
jgi:hypothetical protein